MIPPSPVAILFDGNGDSLTTAPGVPAASAITVQTDPTAPLDVDLDTSTLATHAKQDAQTTELQAIKTELQGILDVHLTDSSVPITAATLPLPTGAATETTLATRASETTAALIKTAVDSLVSALPSGGASKETTQLLVQAAVEAIQAAVEGTLDVHIADASVAVTAASLPLPTGAATSSNQTTLGAQTTKLNDGSNTASVSAAGALKVDGSAVTQPVSAASLPLPTGAATETTLSAVNGKIPSQGQAAMSGSIPVVLASDQTSIVISAASLPLPTGAATAAKQPALGTAGSPSTDVITVQGHASGTALKVDGSAVTQPVSGTFWQATQPVSAVSLPLPSGASTAAKQPALGTAGSASSDVITVQGIASMTALKVDGSAVTQPVVIDSTQFLASGATAPTPEGIPALGWDGSAVQVLLTDNVGRQIIVDGGGSLTVDSTQLPAALVGGRLDTILGSWLGSTAPTVGSKTSANSIPVVIASDQGAVPVSISVTSPATATLTNTSGSASSVTVLASNANRQTATLVNDSTSVCYVKFGSTASTTSYSYYMPGTVGGVPSTLEIPQGPKGPYTGIITAIWVSATGSMRATEVTA